MPSGFSPPDQKRYAVNLLKNDTLPRVDGCKEKGQPDSNDWITDCTVQNQVYWAVNEILVLLAIP